MSLENMKVVLLAGGRGTRMQEITQSMPKPMVEVGGKPILWHIMKFFSSYGPRDFYVALGYKGYLIKDYFVNYELRNSSIRVDTKERNLSFLDDMTEDWSVSLIETGLNAQTGARIARMKDYLSDGPFLMTYGDGLCNVDLEKLLEFHKAHGKIATVTSVHPPSKFGALEIDSDNKVNDFSEKPDSDYGWINGGYFIFEPQIFDYLSTDTDCILEREALEKLAKDGQMVAYKHADFWQCIDTVRELEMVNKMWSQNYAPWKRWEK